MPVSSTHAPTPFRRVLRFLPVAVVCGLVYYASDQPDLRVSDDDTIDFVVRKLAHAGVFGTLAVLVARAIAPLRPRAPRTLVAAWIATLAWAASDEWHQTFVPGRAGQPSDVAIDMAGATVALVAWRLFGPRHDPSTHGAPP